MAKGGFLVLGMLVALSCETAAGQGRPAGFASSITIVPRAVSM